MKPVNLYFQSRIKRKDSFEKIYCHETESESETKIKFQEIKSLEIFVDKAIEIGLNIPELDGFYIGYTIPQIGREFDLLKITDKYCLNIEFKSHEVSEEKIFNQLKEHQYYLRHLGKKLFLFTVNTDKKEVFELNKNQELKRIRLSDIFKTIKEMNEEKFNKNIDELFKVSDFLVSPINTPEKFLKGEYYLTDQQKTEKNKLIKYLSNSNGNFYSLTGKPGTGKTLLLYDIAKDLTKNYSVLIIYCSRIPNGCNILNNCISNLTIVPPKELNNISEILKDKTIIFVDESQRIYKSQFELLKKHVLENNKKCIFSHDLEQCLSNNEKKANIVEEIHKLNPDYEIKLSKRIRTNKEIATFINSMFNLKAIPPQGIKFRNISLLFANNEVEAKKMIKHFKSKNYIFINFTQSFYDYGPYDKYKGLENYNSHHVIGQEFDNVLIIMGENFFYENGKIHSKSHPNPDYLYSRLLYQGLTRVREKLAIIIVENEELFATISTLFAYEISESVKISEEIQRRITQN